MGEQTFLGNLIFDVKRIWFELVYRYFIWISGYSSGPEFELVSAKLTVDGGKTFKELTKDELEELEELCGDEMEEKAAEEYAAVTSDYLED